MAKSDLDKRMAERRARVEAAKAKAHPEVVEEAPQAEEEIEDYWTLPKTGAPTTLLNSAWTWTLIIYIMIMGAAATSISGANLPLAETSNSGTVIVAIAVALIYPAWRIASIISRYMKKRGIGAGFSMTGPGGSSAVKSQKVPPANSIEAKLAARKARLDKARKDGKI